MLRHTYTIVALGLLGALLGCNGTGAGSPPTPQPSPGNGGPAPTTPTVESVAAELGLSPDPVPIDDVMETLETLWYEDAWTAMDDGRLADAAKAFVRAGHLLSAAQPEQEHAGDEQFMRWMKGAAAAVTDAARLALAGDDAGLRTAVETIDEKRCVACHKVYKKDE